MSERSVSDSSARAAEILRSLGGRWALIGALAAMQYRETERLTTDADFLVDRVTGLAQAFEARGYEVRPMSEPGGLPYLLRMRAADEKVDVIIAGTPFEDSALSRAAGNVITAEDVIVFKLLAWRTKDIDDIDSIMAARHALDEAYIEHWAREWETIERWERVKAAARD